MSPILSLWDLLFYVFIIFLMTSCIILAKSPLWCEPLVWSLEHEHHHASVMMVFAWVFCFVSFHFVFDVSFLHNNLPLTSTHFWLLCHFHQWPGSYISPQILSTKTLAPLQGQFLRFVFQILLSTEGFSLAVYFLLLLIFFLGIVR